MSNPELYLWAAREALLIKSYRRKNLTRPTWVGMSRESLIGLLCGEIEELLDEIKSNDKSDASDLKILYEAADVLSYGAMLVTRDGQRPLLVWERDL